jgi:hypothetical protein
MAFFLMFSVRIRVADSLLRSSGAPGKDRKVWVYGFAGSYGG